MSKNRKILYIILIIVFTPMLLIPAFINNSINVEETTTEDVVEEIGVNKAIKEIDIADMIIAVFDVSRELTEEDKKIINLGYSGDNMIGMLRRVPMLKAANPQKIFIMAGTNDLVHIDVDEYRERYANLLQAVKDAVPDAEIYIQSVLPSNHELKDYSPNEKVQEANEMAKALAAEFGCSYINLYDLYVDEKNELPKELTKDGVHLYEEAYDRWAETIRPMVYELN